MKELRQLAQDLVDSLGGFDEVLSRRSEGAAQALRTALTKLLTPDRGVAPWPDFLNQTIHHGDLLTHPDGTEFVAIRLPGSHHPPGDAWRAVYDEGPISRLVLQIGDKGRAVLVARKV